MRRRGLGKATPRPTRIERSYLTIERAVCGGRVVWPRFPLDRLVPERRWALRPVFPRPLHSTNERLGLGLIEHQNPTGSFGFEPRGSAKEASQAGGVTNFGCRSTTDGTTQDQLLPRRKIEGFPGRVLSATFPQNAARIVTRTGFKKCRDTGLLQRLVGAGNFVRTSARSTWLRSLAPGPRWKKGRNRTRQLQQTPRSRTRGVYSSARQVGHWPAQGRRRVTPPRGFKGFSSNRRHWHLAAPDRAEPGRCCGETRGHLGSRPPATVRRPVGLRAAKRRFDLPTNKAAKTKRLFALDGDYQTWGPGRSYGGGVPSVER